MILLILMYSITISICAFISAVVLNKYLQSTHNHIENLWLGVAFIIFGFISTFKLIDILTNGYLSFVTHDGAILRVYAYWIILIVAFRLRQLKNKWSYSLNKKVKIFLLLSTVFSLYFLYALDVTSCGVVFTNVYNYISIGIIVATMIVLPAVGYYIFFRLGYFFFLLAHIACIVRYSPIHYVPHILSFVGLISIAINIYFVFYSDKILDRRDQRSKVRRVEDRLD